MTLREIRADLHIHTCLSPCADLDMTPPNIAAAARKQGLGVIAVCDHNASENTAAVRAAAQPEEIAVFSGMEVTSSEEVHVLVLLDDDPMKRLQTMVSGHLPGVNDPVRFGDQLVTDRQGNPLELCERLLIGATTLPLAAIVYAVQDLGGLAIASHVDRDSFSLLSQLGFIPDDLPLDALEVSPRCQGGDREPFARFGLPLLTASDAHRLDEIGRCPVTLRIAAPTLDELRMALQGRDGRQLIME